MGYVKYGWAANRISEEDMALLYHKKKTTRKTITAMVGEAVKLYLSQHVSAQNKTEDAGKNKVL
ncbi:hypothetical protein BROC_00780 [Candidatus Brocadiaceae bacterium]|nr:hypothetical protein BROC_00780 [Candidatus Brocadiaceae bacterium]